MGSLLRSRLSLPPSPEERPEIRARELGYRRIAGVDEAGRGPLAGPVVAAAVILLRRRLNVRVDDSKRLTARQRLFAYHAILEHALVGVGMSAAATIDGINIRQATLRAMEEAVSTLEHQPDLVLVDGRDPPRVQAPCWPIIGGDHRSYVIACASVVAKVTRDAMMRFYHRLFPAYQFDEHKGYGTMKHLAALAKHGPSVLHRMSFRPIGEVGFFSNALVSSEPHGLRPESLPTEEPVGSSSFARLPASAAITSK